MATNENSVYKIVKGISENDCEFIGRVAEEPYVTDNVAVIKLNTVAAEMDSNNQLVDRIQLVPITVTDRKKIAGIQKYVKKGKQLQVKAYYKSWNDNGTERHALMATRIKYGPDEYKPQNQQQGGRPSGGGFAPPPNF